MAAYLVAQTKAVLLLLAEELEVGVVSSDNKKTITQKIISAVDYDEEVTRSYLKSIREDLDRQEKKEELEKQRQFELEKLRLQNAADGISVNSNSSEQEYRGSRNVLKDLVPKFDPKLIDITLFFMIFERQAVKAKMDENNYVSQLIPLLPADIAELIVKEPMEVSDDYRHIKKLLLKRFRLSAGALKSKFEDHNKKLGSLWTDLSYELKGYLDNWLEILEITDFESFKELMITEQIKKKSAILY